MPAPYGKGFGYMQRKGNRLVAFLPRPPTELPTGFDEETKAWISRVEGGGGAFLANSKALADALIVAIKTSSINSKLVYLLPLLGSGMGAALAPLRDSLGVGSADNTGFIDSDFTQNRGLQGDGIGKIIDTRILPNQLGASGNGGAGWWETNKGSATRGPMGYAHNPGGGTRSFGVYLQNSSYGFSWNKADPGKSIDIASPATNGHYYGQRSSAVLRQLFKAGSLVGTSTVSDPADDAAYTGMRLMGADTSNVVPGPYFWAGRCGCAYMTTGDLTQSEVRTLHNILQSKLISATGR